VLQTDIHSHQEIQVVAQRTKETMGKPVADKTKEVILIHRQVPPHMEHLKLVEHPTHSIPHPALVTTHQSLQTPDTVHQIKLVVEVQEEKIRKPVQQRQILLHLLTIV